MRRLTLIPVLTVLLVGCGGGGGGSTPPPTNQALGGVWHFTNSDGLGITALSTDSGRLHWLMGPLGEIPENPIEFPFPVPAQPQAFGTASATGSAVTINYTLAVSLGITLSDGSASAICSGTGTIQQRQRLTVSVDCVTSLGAAYSDSVSLTYVSPLAERDSALMVVAGNYDHRNSIFSISGNGVIFEQNPVTGCVINGQDSIIDARFNVYDVSITYSSCLGNRAVLNGTTHTGLASFNSNINSGALMLLLIGEVNGAPVSSIFVLIRI